MPIVREAKYLRVKIKSFVKTKIDAALQTCKFYLRTNLLPR